MKKLACLVILLFSSPAIAARISVHGAGSGGSGGGGGSSSLSVEDGDVQVSSPTAAIDFQGAQFIVTESPAGEANVSLNPSSVTLFGTPSLTEGSVLFWSGGILSEDNDNLFWDNVLNRLAVGHKIPTHDLHLSGSALNQFLIGDETGKSLFEVDASLASFGSGTIEFGDIGNNFDGPHFIMDIPGFAVRIESADVGVGGLFSGAGPQSDLDVRGSSSHGIITIATDDATVTNGEKLGQIDFNAPVEASGSDATLPGASIWAEADASFTTTVNDTDLVFATAFSEAATEKMRLTSEGNLGISTTAPTHKLSVQGGMVVTSSSTFNGNVLISSGVLLSGSAGTSGQVLTSGGSGTIPTWTTPSGGGGGSSSLAVGTGTASNFTNNITSPTAAISFDGKEFRSTALGTTNYIQLEVLDVSTGTVNGELSVRDDELGAGSLETANVRIGHSDLPRNGGAGPQVTNTFIEGKVGVESGSVGSFLIFASTTQTSANTVTMQTAMSLTPNSGVNDGAIIFNVLPAAEGGATLVISSNSIEYLGSSFMNALYLSSGVITGGTPGTSGQVLTSAGVNLPPTWETASGGGVVVTGTHTWSGANTFSAVVNLSSTVALSNQKKRMFISATAGMCRISSGCADAIQAETSVSSINYMGSVFANDYDDYWQASFTLPENYQDGSTFTAAVEWASTGTTGGVAWFAQCMSIGDDDTLDTAFGTAIEINDDNTVSGDFLRTAESSAITCSGSPIGGDRVWVQIYRDVDDADDDWTGNANFVGMWLTFNIDRLSSED